MKISTKGRYALRMLLDITEHSGGEYVSLNDIAKRQNISKKYLEQIIPVLNKTGLLKTNRGTRGGYMLTKPSSAITVGEILRLTEGSLAPVSCLENEYNDCKLSESCPTLYVWQGLKNVIEEYLDGISLRDISDRQHSNYSNNYII